jgi:small-conductance mechanosensitive channel
MEDKAAQDIINLFRELHYNRILLLIVGMLLLIYTVKLLNQASLHLTGRFPTKRLLVLQIVTTVNFFVYIVGTMLLIYIVLNPTKELLLALGGGTAVAIGLSLRDLVASLFAGLILLFDRPFQVGDRVQFGDIYGEIKSIGLRAVRLNTLDDNLVTIPNNRFITDLVSSGNSGALDMMIVTPFYVTLDADIKLARDILYETVVSSRFVYLEKPVIISVNEVEAGFKVLLQLTTKAYVLDVKYEKEFQTDVVMRATQAFREHNISRPS